MALGECIKQNFILLAENPTGTQPELTLPNPSTYDCCFEIKVFASLLSGDYYVNDKTSFLYQFSDAFTFAEFTLQQFNGIWQDLTVLNNDDYGTFYPFQFYKYHIGYLIEWKKVLQLHGEGSYRVKLVANSILGSQTYYSQEYCLENYTPEKAASTIRIDYWLNGFIGENQKDNKIRDFGELDWFNQIRLEGALSYISSAYEREFVQYQNGIREWIANKQEPKYKLIIKPIPYYIADILRTDIMQADRVSITQYNPNAYMPIIDKFLIPDSDFEPRIHINQSKMAGVEIDFKQFINNLNKKKC
jgi:hypothetical protein